MELVAEAIYFREARPFLSTIMAMKEPLDPWRALIAQQARRERIRLLYATLPVTAIGCLALALFASFILFPQPIPLLVLAWLCMMVFVTSTTAALFFSYRNKNFNTENTERWESLCAVNSAISGLGWGMLIWLLTPLASEDQKLALVTLVCTASTIATATLVTSPRTYYAFTAAAALPALGYIFSVGKAPNLPIGTAMLLYFFVLLCIHRLLHRLITIMIERHSESESLIKEQQVIFDSSGEAIGFLRPHYLVKCNRQWAELLGYGIDELVGKPAWMWHPSYDEWRDLALTCQQTFFKGEIYRCATQLRRKNGELFWAELSGKAVDPHNPERGSVWIGSDITERRHTESSLRRSEQRFRNLVSLSSDWYWEQDRNGRFTLLSGRLFDDIGLNQAYIEGKTFREIAVPNYTTEEHWNELNTLINDQRPFWNFSFPVRTPSGDLRWFSVSGNPAFDEQGDFDGYHGVGTDITSQVENAERYRHLAHHDTLTGLPNRRLLSDRLERATARAKRDGQRVILMLLDLDEFKAINDTLGHSIGDEVLIVVSQRLKMAIRESDTVARLGGDEFVILLPDARHPHDGNTVAEKVLEVLKEPLLAGGQHHNVRVSIGIAVFPDHAEDCERLFQQADIAMYRTKRKGGGVFLLGDNYKIITGGQSAA